MEQFFAEWDAAVEDSARNKTELYQAMLDKLNEGDGNNVEILWRLVQACLIVADSFEKVGNKSESKKYTEESLKYAKKAVEVGPKSLDAHKW